MRLKQTTVTCAIIAALALVGFAQQPASADPFMGIDFPGSVIFQTMNTAGVENGPTRPAVFQITRPLKITGIGTYHWNSGRGAYPGTISLRGADGTMYGPWRAAGSPGSGVQNVTWYVQPGIVLQPGTYTIVDSDPATWSQNSSSGYRGMGGVLALASQAVPGTQVSPSGRLVSGAYRVTDSDGHAFMFRLTVNGSNITGNATATGYTGIDPLQGSIAGNRVTFQRDCRPTAGGSCSQTWIGTISGNVIQGTWSGTGGSGSWTLVLR
jgi:hypothetical protein